MAERQASWSKRFAPAAAEAGFEIKPARSSASLQLPNLSTWVWCVGHGRPSAKTPPAADSLYAVAVRAPAPGALFLRQSRSSSSVYFLPCEDGLRRCDGLNRDRTTSWTKETGRFKRHATSWASRSSRKSATTSSERSSC